MLKISYTTSKRIVVIFAMFVVLFLLVGCTESKVEVDSITLDKNEATLKVGESLTVIATISPEAAENQDIVWNSSDLTIATVTDGVITAVGVGQVAISAAVGRRSDALLLTVNPRDYTITFNTNGGNAVSNQVIVEGGQISMPTPPTKEGHDFSGWFADAGFNTAFNFSTLITENKTLFAKWTLKEYTVAFNVDDVDIATESVEHGEKVDGPTEPTKQGYIFGGWFEDVALTIPFDFDNAITNTKILYGKWEPRVDTPYTVRHFVYNNDTELFDLDSIENFLGATGQTITADPKLFSGLMPEENSYQDVVLADGSLVIDIRYIEFSYTYEYELNGGNFTYESKNDMVEDFLNDYNTLNYTSYTIETLPMGAWTLTNFHIFFLNTTYKEKWMWMPTYLGIVGSTTNKKACSDITTVSTTAQFTAISANWVYALSYEVRGFLAGRKYIENANWMSSDYSEYGLGNGFWPIFVARNEVTKFENQKGVATLVANAYKEGYTFEGWYSTADFTGDPVISVNNNATLYAKWAEMNPVTSISITNPVTTLEKLDTHQLTIHVLPEDAFNKNVAYSTSDETILGVSETGLVTAHNAGTASITVSSVLFDISDTFEITVLPQDDLDIRFDEDFNGTLFTDGETQITVVGVGNLKDSEIEFESSNTAILTVSNVGLVEAVAKGGASIAIKLKSTGQTMITVTIPVIDEPTSSRIDTLLSLLIDTHMPVVDSVNASLYYDNYSAYQQYYDAVYSSVNLFLFDNLNLDSTNYLIDPLTATSKHSGLKPSTEFITVHDTANLNGGLVAHANFWLQPTATTSGHFSVGDYGVIQSLDTAYTAHHAGDGTSTAFSWRDTGIAANGNMEPVINISVDGFFTFNGIKGSIAAPTGSGGMILDASYFGNLGPTWTLGSNGNYHVGTAWFSTTQVARGIISSRGGNLNSTAIEMCVNRSGDIYDTWQRTAKLVGNLMIEHSLDITRVVQHNTFSGKNCPQSLLMSDYWATFMEMVKIEHEILDQYVDATITMVSHNPTVLSNTGRIISQSQTTQVVSYTITVQIGAEQQSITLYSVVPGTASWKQLNGFYSTR